MSPREWDQNETPNPLADAQPEREITPNIPLESTELPPSTDDPPGPREEDTKQKWQKMKKNIPLILLNLRKQSWNCSSNAIKVNSRNRLTIELKTSYCAYETCVSAPGDAGAGHAKTRKPRKRENGQKREHGENGKNAKTRTRRKRENESKSLLEWSQKSMPEIDLGLEVVVLMLTIREWWLSQRLL